MSKSINWLTERLIKINDEKSEKKFKMAEDLFEDILNDCDLYIVALKDTTDEELKSGRVRPYIQTSRELDNKYYLRLFTNESLAKDFAGKAGCVKNDKELVIKVSKEEFILQIRDAFMMMGLDGIFVDDGKYFVTISTEQFLKVATVNVLKIEKGYDINFINTVRCIFDIQRHRYRLVAPLKKYEGVSKEDFINGKAEVYPFDNEVLIFEYYEKYKLENIIKEEPYYLDLDFNEFYLLIKRAVEKGISRINMVYAGRSAIANPKDILGLLEIIK